MYNLIYDFIYDNLLVGYLDNYTSEIMGVSTNFSEWLAHCLTITSIVLIFVFLVLFIKWTFKLVSGLLRV